MFVHSVKIKNGYLFLCTFLILVLFWGVRFYQDSQAAEHIKTAYIILCAVVLGVWLTFLILLSIYSTDVDTFKAIHRVEVCFASGVQFLGSLAYLYFGTKLYCKLKDRSSASPRVQKMHKTIGVLTVFETIILSTRALYLMVVTFYNTLNDYETSIVYPIASLLFDLLPPVVVMIVLGQLMPRTIGAQVFLVNNPTYETERERERLVFTTNV